VLIRCHTFGIGLLKHYYIFMLFTDKLILNLYCVLKTNKNIVVL